MTNQAPVTLDDLKGAVTDYEYWVCHVPSGDGYEEGLQRLRAEAWRTAFEWRNKFEMVTELQTPNMAEYREGMAVIREKLR